MESIVTKSRYFSCTVVRKLSTGKLEFHRYRNVRATPANLDRFHARMQSYDLQRGRALYVNYYDKQTRIYSHRHVF